MSNLYRMLFPIIVAACLLLLIASFSRANTTADRYFQEAAQNELTHEQAFSYYRGNFTACGLSLLSGESFKHVDNSLFQIFATRVHLPPKYQQVAPHIDNEYLLLGENATYQFMLGLTEAEKLQFCQRLFNHYSSDWVLSDELSEP
ncbi:hypothetical protein L4C54_01920 [Vibrio lamellibrachiae]|uniref:hypothetical protein n=1 Tax=Vibrio lamellibrachiae TaxID=2910253 RepID=UPI003D0E05D1